MTASPAAPPEYRPVNSPDGVTALAVAVVLWVVAAAFVGLRFRARRQPLGPGIDDWVILWSLVPTLGLCLCTVLWSVLGGLGWHIKQLSQTQVTKTLEV